MNIEQSEREEFSKRNCAIIRTVRIDDPVTGTQIVDALRQLEGKNNVTESYHSYNKNFGNYTEDVLLDLDGVLTFRAGLANELYPDVSIRVGKNLEDESIQLEQTYEFLGVGTSYFEGPKITTRVYHSSQVKYIEAVRDGLEKILNGSL